MMNCEVLVLSETFNNDNNNKYYKVISNKVTHLLIFIQHYSLARVKLTVLYKPLLTETICMKFNNQKHQISHLNYVDVGFSFDVCF